MLLTGQQKLERLRDGRTVYVGSEKVNDVTTHPAFKRGAQTIAELYDMKADASRHAELSFEEDGDRYSLYWLRCRNRDDLARRMRAIKTIAEFTYGLIGRSPDHVAGLVTGMSTNHEVLNRLHAGFGDNLINYYKHARKNDLYLCFAVVPPTGLRSTELFPGQEREDPSLQVVAEDAEGVTLSGMKMLATGAVYSDEIWVGNLTPIDDKYNAESITCALPVSTPGVTLWSREPYARDVRFEEDYPLSWRFDDSDCVLVCDRV
jgi:4-hydroxyphenylacetate 3-monooxygenase